MQARNRINITLAVAVGAIGLVIAWLLWDDYRGDPMLDLDPGQVRELRSEHEGAELWRMRREDGDWSLQFPFQAPADRHRMEQLLPLLRAPVHSRYSTEEVDPARFGLDEPSLVIAADEVRIAFADMEGPDRRRYARVGDEILVIDEMVYFQFSRAAEHFADRDLLPREASIEAIEFPATRLQRDTDGHWELDPPDDANGPAADQLAQQWQQARADDVHHWPAPLEQALIIRVHFRDADPRVFHLLEADGRLVLGDIERGLRYEFDAARLEQMLPGRDE